MSSLYGDSAVCFFFFVVCSFSTLKSRAVYTSLSIHFIQKDISPLDGEKNTESECQMQSVGRKKKEILGRFELHFCMIELKVD